MRTRTSWVVKLRPAQEPKVVPAPRDQGRMLVPTPMLVAEAIRRIRKGALTTPTRIREELAGRFLADVTCPLTTGIFLNIIAGAAEEQLAEGKRPVAPWWRVVQEDGTLNPKRPPGEARQAARLRAEGHQVRKAPGGVWTVRSRATRSPRPLSD